MENHSFREVCHTASCIHLNARGLAQATQSPQSTCLIPALASAAAVKVESREQTRRPSQREWAKTEGCVKWFSQTKVNQEVRDLVGLVFLCHVQKIKLHREWDSRLQKKIYIGDKWISVLLFFFLIKIHGFLFLPFIYLFLIALGLHCCKQAFSSCGEWNLLSSCTQRSRCSGWSCWSVGSRHTGFSCSMQALEPRLSSCHAWPLLLHNMWNLPRPGIEPMSPAWQVDSYPLYHQGSPKINVVVSSSISI